jgi:hypothetical protein
LAPALTPDAPPTDAPRSAISFFSVGALEDADGQAAAARASSRMSSAHAAHSIGDIATEVYADLHFLPHFCRT